MIAYPFADNVLALLLERAEAENSARFVDVRAKLAPETGATWINVGGTFALFDGADSPLTQTFGFGLFEPPRADDLTAIEQFFADRLAPVFHEVSPLANPAHAPLLASRGYEPFEFTSVMYRPITGPDDVVATNAAIHVRLADANEHEKWARTAAGGWSDVAELGAFMRGVGLVSAMRPDAYMFLALHQGRPIATALLNICGGIALFAGASTVPDGRGLGAQLALLAARMTYAATHGCDLAMVAALPGSRSQRNAERHGFRIAYTRTKWRQRR